ncbi:hypothetical protein [Priestia koreensis]|uniref:Peptide ABC transporter substrate-binding protein n=1 Tax=Priestia koreensis TaxID=284581 RepID=A0A0M0KVW9_9BACI|nr:hypothetical protein [Priestia koreensis]KOO42787.1 peptide ABC transporter substrate-binding protein [Priestia koreensis]MCM3005462.1 peptide ABC transporter substrate-binding protein [Priestia koreensis]
MKFKFISILFVLATFLVACNMGEDPKDHLGEIYTVVLDSIMKEDKSLNSDMEFIAIDMSSFNEVNGDDKKVILSYFRDKYNVDVMNATMDKLKDQGYYNQDTMSLDGVLLKIEKIEVKFNNSVLIQASKFRSGKGAIGVESKVHYKDGKWKIKESNEIWAS